MRPFLTLLLPVLGAAVVGCGCGVGGLGGLSDSVTAGGDSSPGSGCDRGDCGPQEEATTGNADNDTAQPDDDQPSPVCTVDADCDDGRACNGVERCVSTTCEPGTPIQCPRAESACQENVCNDNTSGDPCVLVGKSDGTACDDGDLCTQTDTCQEGACVGANPIACSAVDPCHQAGTCDPATGVCSTPAALDGAGCDDGDLCTVNDACTVGVCVGSVKCNDGLACTDDACDPATGTCSATDNDANCPNGEVCTDGVCELPFTLVTMHIQRDLPRPGCDIWNPHSIGCRWAGFQACLSLGYGGGSGPVEYGYTIASVACAKTSVSSYREFAYDAGCTTSDPTSLACQSYTHRQCIAQGFQGSMGAIGYDSSVIATNCLSSGGTYLTTTLADLETVDSGDAGCSEVGILSGNGCQHVIHRWCQAQGYGTGFGPLEYNGSQQVAGFVCVEAGVDDGGFTRGPDVDGYKRAAVLGDNVVGGPAFAGQLVYADGIYNAFSEPILIRRITSYTSYTGSTYSRDACLFLNRMGIWQFDDNDDGEINCTYSDQAQTPTTDFLDRGILLNPGEGVWYQATPQWGVPGGYAWATLNVSELGSAVPLRRVRFPKWDTGYAVTSSLTIGAGHAFQDPPIHTPANVPPGKPLQESNWWYLPTNSVAIRGMSIFMSHGQASGTQGVTLCIRVVAQGGANLITPICRTIDDDLFGPGTYTTDLGTDGSSFFPLEVDVPDGALIGVDFTLTTQAPTGLDFAGYLWLEQS